MQSKNCCHEYGFKYRAINHSKNKYNYMNNYTNKKHPVHALLDNFFVKPEVSEVIAEYQRMNSNHKKWLMFSDYCLDDKNKANDVMTFVLMPYVSEEKFCEMQKIIHDQQPSDIKKASKVNEDFLSYLKSENVLTFSFVFNDRKHFFASSYDQCLEGVRETLETIRDCYEGWKSTAQNEDILEHYKNIVKKLNYQLAPLKGKSPNIKLLNDILIAAFLGAYVSSKVLEKLSIEIFGWFSDRDSIISGKENIIVPVFHFYQHNMLGGHHYQFCTFTPDSRIKPFYDEFNRIADVITGAIADYNMENNYITSDKFNTVLVDYLAGNKHALIFRIYKVSDNYHVSHIVMNSK